MADKPTYTAYAVETTERDGKEDTQWTPIGAAWPHKDGKGLTVQLRALPVAGSIVLREPSDKPAEKSNERNGNSNNRR